jgi:outer membrane PBP1 activator LpoA protein
MGADAWSLTLRQHRLSAAAGLRYRGYTALFSADDQGVLLRELPMAEFDGGQLRRR